MRNSPLPYKKLLVIIAVLYTVTAGMAQTARDYYNELYKTGGLDRMADEYVCFDDQTSLQTFFIFAESKVLRDFLIANGGFAKLPSKYRAELNKDFLNFRFYDKGVAQPDEEFFDKDGDSWIEKGLFINKATPMRIRFTIQWQTLRYKRSVEILNSDYTLRYERSRYGRCEKVSSAIRQKEH